jgi:TPR repeat protein
MPRTAPLVSAGFIFLLGAIPVAHAADFATPRIANRSEVANVRRTMALAQRGDAHAQAILGFMYANGRGVPQSYDVAVDWYAQSAAQGDATGQYLLGLMYDKGFGVIPNVIVAYKWLNLAAAHAPWRVREDVLRLRDAVASKMTRAQLDSGQQLAVDFVPIRP